MGKGAGGQGALAVLATALVVFTVGAVVRFGPFNRSGGHIALAIISTAVVVLLVALLELRRRTSSDLDGRLADAEAQRDAARRDAAREREWNRILRAKTIALQHSYGAWGASRDDVRSLVLRTAVELVEAKRGLLLSRADEDGDGRLDLVASVGFESDAANSEIAQRFAAEVLERDTIVREDEPGDGASRADDEIDSLVAIPIWTRDEFSGVVVCAGRDGGFEDVDDDVLLALGDHAGAVLQTSELQSQLQDSFRSTVRLLADAIQAKDPFLRGHSEDVAGHVEAVARELGIEGERRERLAYASLLHDVGKIGISERLLLKPGRLTPQERAIVELHPRIGYRMLEQVPGMHELAPAVLHHHERFDGLGYPGRLSGEAIPLEARIIGVADAYSAMTEQRPYRERMSLDAACDELERCSGSQFDPEIVRLFVAQVRSGPPRTQLSIVAAALDDSELASQRTPGEPVLGSDVAAMSDGVTLLYSHRFFQESVARAVEVAQAGGEPVSVGLVSLAALDEINAASGYAGGDAALRDCARALSRVAVRHGAVAARIGGTRLGLIATGLDAEGAAALGTALADELGEVGWSSRCHVAAVSWRAGETASELLRRGHTLLGAGREMAPLSD